MTDELDPNADVDPETLLPGLYFIYQMQMTVLEVHANTIVIPSYLFDILKKECEIPKWKHRFQISYTDPKRWHFEYITLWLLHIVRHMGTSDVHLIGGERTALIIMDRWTGKPYDQRWSWHMQAMYENMGRSAAEKEKYGWEPPPEPQEHSLF